MNNWHRLTVEEISFESGTDTKMGKINIDSKRKRSSLNTVFALPRVDSRKILKHMLSDASLLLLLFTFVLTAFIGKPYESYAGIVIVLFVFAFGCYFKYRSSKRITNSYNLALPIAKVTENGIKKRLSVFDVEAGDLIEFKQGDIIPADARLVTSDALRVAERFTDPETGKISYVQRDKSSDALVSDDAEHESYFNTVYAGSMVVSGKGSAIVHSIGKETKLCRVYSPITIAQENDIPNYIRSFYSVCKRISLSVLIAVIPVTFIALYTQTLNTSVSNEDHYNLLYLFLVALSVSVTCMSELVISPAETLITKDILPSSKKKALSENQSRITKLSSAEIIADVDTLLILSPDVLRDSRTMVRRVYFDSKEFRFDALESSQLAFFKATLSSYYKSLPRNKIDRTAGAVREFVRTTDKSQSDNIVYINNFPTEGAVSRVFQRDSNKQPQDYIAQTSDVSIISLCSHIRTEGGGVWAIDRSSASEIIEKYENYIADGLKLSLLISKSEHTDACVFEGMIAVGDEYPYADGDLFAEYSESGISPILVFQNESQRNVDFALKCGLVSDLTEIALASHYYRSGLSVSDAPANTKVYIGFGRKGTSELVLRLKKANHNILPIIKDSAQRHDILPLTVYATHSAESHETTKLATALSLKPAEADSHSGGLTDALRTVRGSSLARIKLGAYKNYLIFSSVSRVATVALPMLLGFSRHIMSAFMILFSGFLCDFLALWSFMSSSGKPIRLKNSASEAQRLFSPTLAFMYTILAFISSLSSVLIVIFLTNAKAIPLSSASTFLMISLIGSQFAALAGLLLILKHKTRGSGINYTFFISLLLVLLLVYSLTIVPENITVFLSYVGMAKIDLKLIPYALPSSLIVLIGSLVINKLISSFSTKIR